MTLYEENLKKTSTYGYWAFLAHIPVFMTMAYYFKTQMSIAIGVPLLLIGMHFFLNSIKSSHQFNSVLFGFSSIVLSGAMIHLGKGMIEWHFHIFVTLGILCLFANPYTIVAAAATAAVHHLAFYFLLPESVFNYQASLGIVVIHAAFVVVEAVACTFIAYKFKNILELQDRINNEISPLIQSIESASKSSSLTANYLSQASDENSSAITEISATANEITAMVKRTKDLIHKSLQTLIESNKSVSESSDAVSQGEQFLMSLNELKDKMEDLNGFSEKQLGTVVDAVSLISDKTQVINDIVFQTKLLSFNASVEAARAGEYGKGFSVVAEEVGKLAQSSGEASQEIAHIVDQSKVDLEESVKSITNELQRFGEEVKVACDNWNVINNQLQSSFEVVEKSAGDQESSLQEITTAADNQTEGVQELAQALDSIETSITSSMKQIRELTNTSNHLAQDSLRLNKLHEEISNTEGHDKSNVVDFPVNNSEEEIKKAS